jgi:hypothetical protein
VNPSRFFMHVSIGTIDVFSFSTIYILYHSRRRDGYYIRHQFKSAFTLKGTAFARLYHASKQLTSLLMESQSQSTTHDAISHRTRVETDECIRLVEHVCLTCLGFHCNVHKHEHRHDHHHYHHVPSNIQCLASQRWSSLLDFTAFPVYGILPLS